MGLPTGASVTFLFTDIEGSTRLERAVGSATWANLVARHDALLRVAIEGQGGAVVKTEGDAFFAAFGRPEAAAAAAVVAQRAVAVEPWPPEAPLRVRMGLHLGAGRLRQGGPPGTAEDYVGIDVNYAARIAAVGNGGQIVLSDALVTALGSRIHDGPLLADVSVSDEGLRAVKDFEEPARLYRLVVPGAADDTRRLRTLDAPSNLPGELTELIGREAEVAAVQELLLSNRVVTVTGPGGSGKTRLALSVARGVIDRFPHGVCFVDLASVRDPDLLAPAIATTVGVRESPERPPPRHSGATSGTGARCSCWTTSNSCCPARRAKLPGCFAARRTCGSWPPAGNCSGSAASAAIPSRHSIPSRASRYSWIGRWPSGPTWS